MRIYKYWIVYATFIVCWTSITMPTLIRSLWNRGICTWIDILVKRKGSRAILTHVITIWSWRCSHAWIKMEVMYTPFIVCIIIITFNDVVMVNVFIRYLPSEKPESPAASLSKSLSSEDAVWLVPISKMENVLNMMLVIQV